MFDVDDFFRCLADQTRLRCLVLLARLGPICVRDLTIATGLTQPKISRHLGALRRSDVVLDDRHGLRVYYSLHPALPAWARNVLGATADGLQSVTPYADDLKMEIKSLGPPPRHNSNSR